MGAFWVPVEGRRGGLVRLLCVREGEGWEQLCMEGWRGEGLAYHIFFF